MINWIKNLFKKKDKKMMNGTRYGVMIGESGMGVSRSISGDTVTSKKTDFHSRGMTRDNSDTDFLTSMAIGYATDSTIAGALVGGDVLGGMLGDMLNSDESSESTPENKFDGFGGGSFGGAGASSSYEDNTPSSYDNDSTSSYDSSSDSSFDSDTSTDY